MRKRLMRRPSAGAVIGVIALVAALGGTAIAGNKIHFDSLAKDTKQKVLPYGSAASNTGCDPTTLVYVTCVQANLNVSKNYPRRAMVVANGTFTTGPAAAAAGTCRLTMDGQQIGALTRLGAAMNTHEGERGDGFGLSTIAPSIGGNHAYALQCNETEGNLKVQDSSITTITLRG
jgi:hypothetical protein